ncbi:MAG: hypothetical protein ACM3UX_00585 [Candidatus Woesearchaeota archaeon]
MRATRTDNPSVAELQDAVRGRAGVRVGNRWRTIEGEDEGQEALLFQRFSGGRVWQTIIAFRADGTIRAVP